MITTNFDNLNTTFIWFYLKKLNKNKKNSLYKKHVLLMIKKQNPKRKVCNHESYRK